MMASTALGDAGAPLSTELDPAKIRAPKLTTIDLIGGILCHICQSILPNKKEYDSHYIQHETGSSDVVYTCVVCYRDFVGYPSFRGHCYASHIIKDKYKCVHCNKHFSKNHTLNIHMKALHMFICSNCNLNFPSKKELHIHEAMHKSEMTHSHQCQTCNLKIDSIDLCELHVDLHYSIIYTCPICQEPFTKKETTKHLSKHFDDVLTDEGDTDKIPDSSLPEDSSINIIGGILCCYCNNLFKNRMEFDTHFTASHQGHDLVYSCNMCSKKFDKYSHFKDHCYGHCTRGRFECDLCCKRFSRLSLLVKHMEGHRGSEGQATFECGQCGRVLTTQRRFLDHCRNVHNDACEQTVCPHPGCGQKFTSPKDVILHRKYHESNLQHWCRMCGLRFHSLASCEKHLHVHKKKYFECPVCRRSYSERYQLMRHVPAHFETVLHVCNVCGKVYNARNRLIFHMKTHAATKDYNCNLCGKGFVRSERLEHHINLHKGARPYNCPSCPKAFTSYAYWYKHLRNVHKVDPKTFKRPEVEPVFKKTIPEEREKQMDTNTDSVTPSEDIEGALSSAIEEIGDITDFNVNDCSDYHLEELANAVLADDVAAPASEPTQEEQSPPSAPPADDIPLEFGPDFAAAGLEGLDDPPLPHIDPLLTMNEAPDGPDAPRYDATHLTTLETFSYTYDSMDAMDAIDPCPKWEPPIITNYYVF